LTVADHGPGLTEEEAPRVFERFYRADDSRARASGGAGLGLSIVAAVTEAHGGNAEARPTPGGGATFVVTLPLAGS
jgi:two-component system OmpR family sensor kinase